MATNVERYASGHVRVLIGETSHVWKLEPQNLQVQVHLLKNKNWCSYICLRPSLCTL